MKDNEPDRVAHATGDSKITAKNTDSSNSYESGVFAMSEGSADRMYAAAA